MPSHDKNPLITWTAYPDSEEVPSLGNVWNFRNSKICSTGPNLENSAKGGKQQQVGDQG